MELQYGTKALIKEDFKDPRNEARELPEGSVVVVKLVGTQVPRYVMVTHVDTGDYFVPADILQPQ